MHFTALYSALLVCIPLQIKRTYFEEKNSLAIFGGEYQQYREIDMGLLAREKGDQEIKILIVTEGNWLSHISRSLQIGNALRYHGA